MFFQADPKPAADAEDDDDEDIDLFGSDDEVDEEAEKLKAERLAAYHAKKAKKPGIIAKSNIILDVSFVCSLPTVVLLMFIFVSEIVKVFYKYCYVNNSL